MIRAACGRTLFDALAAQQKRYVADRRPIPIRMNYEKLSTHGLLLLHGAIALALAADDNAPTGGDKLYGVREFPDWKVLSDALEVILDTRGIKYSKIGW